jgi:hypothetical protein
MHCVLLGLFFHLDFAKSVIFIFSDLTITTRHIDNDIGTRVRYSNDGNVKEQQPIVRQVVTLSLFQSFVRFRLAQQ